MKANGAAKILEKFGEIHRKIMVYGTTSKISVDKALEEKKAF